MMPVRRFGSLVEIICISILRRDLRAIISIVSVKLTHFLHIPAIVADRKENDHHSRENQANCWPRLWNYILRCAMVF